MKRMAIAGLLAAALALAPLSQEKAAAWGCGNCGGGFGFSIGLSFQFNCQANCSPGFCFGGCGAEGMAFPSYGYGYGCPTGDCGSYAYGAPAYPSYPAAPTAAPAPAAVQNAAYTYPTGYGYGYGYGNGQAPSYWYGH